VGPQGMGRRSLTRGRQRWPRCRTRAMAVRAGIPIPSGQAVTVAEALAAAGAPKGQSVEGSDRARRPRPLRVLS